MTIAYDVVIRQFSKSLQSLSTLIDKAEAHAVMKKIDPSQLLQARLIADQFSFIRQVQITCDNAKGAAGRLSGKQPPRHEDVEQTAEQLKDRIRATLDYLSTFKAGDFQAFAEAKIRLPWVPDKFLTGEDYFFQHVIPNFYFHMTTAYAILRANGVDVGKVDFLGPLPFKAI